MTWRRIGPLSVAMALGATVALYSRWGRPWVLNWGARPDEINEGLPGDDILSDASLQTTRAITINTSPERIWPWLVQMGPRPRAGAYTYDWVERLLGIDIENKDRILPEYQHLEPGEFLGLDKKGAGLVVREVLPQRVLVLQWQPAQSTWTFVLQPDGSDRTRLISRNRLPGKGPFLWLGMVLLMEPGSLAMERKMLLTIKRLAEPFPAT